jgi:hypothetical protein
MEQVVKTRQTVAGEYGITTKALNAWIKSANLDIPSRKLLSPKSIKLIYDHFGYPKSSQIDLRLPNK